jgi:hypothetical protein
MHAMEPSPKWSVRSEFKTLDARELLACPLESLLGVTADAATALGEHGFHTVFDLATSPMFSFAREALLAAQGRAKGVGASGRFPGEVLDDSRRDLSIEALPAEPIESFRGLNSDAGRKLAAALGVTNIGELAIWPPYRDAQSILSESYGGSPVTTGDPDSPLDLIPGSRKFPTERVQYDVLVMDVMTSAPEPEGMRPENLTFDPASMSPRSGNQVRGRRGNTQTETFARIDVTSRSRPSPLEAAGQLDLSTLAQTARGFERLATGAILTYTQSWYMEGLSLGQLLHTVALAPGESTKIAMIDWSRRTSTTAQEGIAESEILVSDLARTRSISEIVNAVATEAQQGFSKSSGWSVGGQIGHAGGGAGSADLSQMSGGGGGGGGVPVKLAAAHGESIGIGGGYASAESTGWTTGQRNLSANMAQNVMDRTHQASTSSRNRWATIVREVSQSESERISTRAVTNFNHMHALSIEYFEIVQMYRVVVELTKATQCLFVPMKVLNFERPGVIARFRQAIAAAGLTPRVRALREVEPDRMVMMAPARFTQWDPEPVSQMLGEKVGERGSASLVLPLNFYIYSITLTSEGGQQPFNYIEVEYQDGRVINTSQPAVPDIGPYKVFLTRNEAGSAAIPIFDSDVVQIRLRKNPNQVGFAGTVELKVELYSLRREGFPMPQGASSAELKFYIDVRASDLAPVALEFTRTVTGRELFRHLSDNALYYSQAVWRSLDTATIGQMLSNYSYDGRPVLSGIDPIPLAVAGNYLVFRRHLPPGDQPARTRWESWLEAQDVKIGERQESTVPLPSGGVFAEAVLGRFNSAEKLDITRFWNWQDSPIPITAPDIAAIQAASRAQPEGLVPGQLGQPVLKIEVPPDLPDPEGLKAILQAIQNGNMFRDMSGLGSTIGFAQSALGRAFDSARDAASQAGENMKTAVELYKAAFGGQGNSAATGGKQTTANAQRNASETGALINQGRDMDSRNVPRLNGGERPGTNPGGTGGDSGKPRGTWEGDAIEAGLGTGNTGGGAGAQYQQVLGPLGIGIAGEIIGGLTVMLIGGAASSLTGQSETVEVIGFNEAAFLLEKAPQPSRYQDYDVGEPGWLNISFENLGDAVLGDGVNLSINVMWDNCRLANLDAVDVTDDQAKALADTVFKRNVRITDIDRVDTQHPFVGKGITGGKIEFKLLPPRDYRPRIVNVGRTGMPSRVIAEVVPRIGISINLARVGGRVGPWYREFQLQNPATGGNSSLTFRNDGSGGIQVRQGKLANLGWSNEI